MNFRTEQLPAGLYLVATPIGNARDITLRALDILASADVIAAEDTRSARRLMEIHGIGLNGRQVIAYHDHSGPRVRERLAAAIANGQSCAYVSEAGTPLISDPGFALGREILSKGLPLWTAPGPSAVIAALTVAGLPTDRFLFLGFAPTHSAQRKALWQEVGQIQATLVFYESPKRIQDSLNDLCETLGENRQMVICREVTKRFEEVLRGSVADISRCVAQRSLKGECVVLVDRADGPGVSEEDVDAALKQALRGMRVKDAATAVAGRFGLSRREIYARALDLAGRD